MQATVTETLSDPNWFPFRFDYRNDRLLFAWIPRDLHERIVFLSDLRQDATPLRWVPVAAIEEMQIASGPLHFIQHSGLNGSTLLAHALFQPTVVVTLKEPPILTDLVGFGLASGSQERSKLARGIARLLARPFDDGQATIIKMSSVGNLLVDELADESSRLLGLHAPLEAMLTSLTAKGDEGRMGGRRLFVGLKNSQVTEFGFSDDALGRCSDLQLAALAWLAMQRLIVSSFQRFGPSRSRSLDSETLFANPKRSLQAIATHFKVALDVEQRVEAGILDRHSKTGKPFDLAATLHARARTMETFGGEIRSVVEWAEKIAAGQAIPLSLPRPLFGAPG